MKYYFFLIVLSKEINPLSGNTVGICSNKSIGEPLECCVNYRQIGEACEECSLGTHGPNCTTPCPHGFYGRFCGETCKQCGLCDPVIGCVEHQNATGKTTNRNDYSKGVNWLTIAMSVTGSCLVSLPFGMFTYFKRRVR
ncbi:scavenger receptor class F member 2-like [Saccostrea echinata]|uniref:scavenger receptor class F member 2-like n=1 Tax=Saccostrea echinata TaxID=191078 RepID=UPI002A81C4B0|nr:scavenger receptor class F member 2-like [Saccostrea echinata]